MLTQKQKKALTQYRLIRDNLNSQRSKLDQAEDEAFNYLIEQLKDDESPPSGKTIGETLKELFYSGKGRTKFCLTRGAMPERDSGIP